jgi:hypothetical protein
VLLAVIKCGAGVHLSDDSVCRAYQASFMLGNPDMGQRSRHKEVTGESASFGTLMSARQKPSQPDRLRCWLIASDTVSGCG